MLISMRLNRRGWEDALRDFASARTMTVDVGAVHGGRTVGPLRSICGSVYPQRQRIEQGRNRARVPRKRKFARPKAALAVSSNGACSPARTASCSQCLYVFFVFLWACLLLICCIYRHRLHEFVTRPVIMSSFGYQKREEPPFYDDRDQNWNRGDRYYFLSHSCCYSLLSRVTYI
jgi:hypothetical protein